MQKAINFDTFYYLNLLDSIKELAGEDLENNLLDTLFNFINFLTSTDDPIGNIEKLAELQGTSDISIFFSDLLERIKQNPPAKAVEQMGEYAHDFLEIFKVIAQEPTWGENVLRDLKSFIPLRKEYLFKEYIHKQIKDRVLDKFMTEKPVLENSLINLFNRIENDESIPTLFEEYSRDKTLQNSITLLKNVYQTPVDDNSLQHYIENFDQNVGELSQELVRISDANKDIFETFCAGKPFRSFTGTEDTKLEELIESFDQDQRIGEETDKLTQEDKNLRWLLRDYLIHEIDELSNEVNTQLEKLVSFPTDIESRSIVLDNLKVLKDLGQIHKYSRIEKISGELLQHLKDFFERGEFLPLLAVQAMNDVLSSFIKYIDAVLEGKEEAELKSLEEKKNYFLEILSATMPVEILISLSEKEKIEPVFSEVNQLFLQRTRNNYISFSENTDDEQKKEALINDLAHLKSWYDLLKLSGGASNVLEVILNWLGNPQKHQKLIAKREQIFQSFDSMSHRLYTTSPEQWTSYIEKLTKIGPVKTELEISKSIQAFKDVSERHLKAAINALCNNDLEFKTVVNENLQISLQQLVQNSELIDSGNVKALGEFLLNKQSELLTVSDENVPKLRNLYAEFLDQIINAITKLPEKFQSNDFIKDFEMKFNNIVTQLTDSSEIDAQESIESPSLKAEGAEVSSLDKELRDTFFNDANQFLLMMEENVEYLKENLTDESRLKDLSNVFHSFKDSAKTLNFQDIRSVLDPMEHLTGLLLRDKVNLSQDYLFLCTNVIQSIREQLEGKQIDLTSLIDSIENYIHTHFSKEEFTEDTKKKAEKFAFGPPQEVKETQDVEEFPVPEGTIEETEVSREALVKLQEKDPELLDIFRNEAADNLNSIEKNLTLIEKFHHDKQTLQSLDHSVHEIRSAAKMLGFSEIGSLMDKLENLIELLNNSDAENVKEMIPAFRKVIEVVRKLAAEQEVSRSLYDDAVDSISFYLTHIEDNNRDETQKKSEAISVQEKPGSEESSDIMLQSFIQESREFLEDLNFILMKIEKDPEDEELVHRLMRTFHTLKGSAAMVGQEAVEKLTHLSEEIIEKSIQNKESLDEAICEAFFNVIDEIDCIISSLATGEEVTFKNFDTIIEKLETELVDDKKKSLQKGKSRKKKTSRAVDATDEYFSITDRVESKESAQIDTHIKLRTEQIDNLLKEAAELVINHNQFRTQIDKFKGLLPRMDMEGKNLQNILWHFDKIVKEQQQFMELVKSQIQNAPFLEESQKNQFDNIQKMAVNLQKFNHNFSHSLQGLKDSGRIYDEQIQKLIRLSTQIHDEIIKARLVPIGLLFQRFNRPMRDIAKKYGKKIRFYLEGENTELDRILAEKLYEPVLHILRNAIDHGIEPPKDRKKLGKPEEGLIKISAHQERNFINVTIEDDGKGINVDQIRNRAIELGYLQEDLAQELTDPEIFEFLLHSGFSTSKEITPLSGRGFGLDVVRNQIQKIKGDLRIYSVPQKGTRFIIRLPISLTVTQAILVEVNKNIYAIPLLQVEETTEINPADLIQKKGNYYIRHRGYELPVINLSSLLVIKEKDKKIMLDKSRYPLINIQDEGKRIGLLVEKVLQREEILIKSLGKGLERVRFVLGGSILADGKVVLVLDIPQIVFYSLRLRESTFSLKSDLLKKPKSDEKSTISSKKRSIREEKPSILIIDDSLSVRKFLSGLLTKNKFNVDVAKNGYAALEKLNQSEFDLIITDLEMPQLTGYELIEQIRSDSRWEDLPIIVLTGRASKHIEDHALKLGADEFIIKPFKEKDLIKKIKNFIVSGEKSNSANNK